jgi:hypothetical protein
MIRDRVKPSTYFDERIDYDHSVIQEVTSRLDSGSLSPYGQVMAANNIRSKIRNRIVMRYSRGDDLSLVRTDVDSLLAARTKMKACCDALPSDEQHLRTQFERLSFDNYLIYLWWLSWVVCLNMGKEHTRQVLALIGNAGQDLLLDRIAPRLGGAQPACTGALAFPKQNDLLLQSTNAPVGAQSALVKKFLEGWYKRNKNLAAWYDTHHDDDSGYVGYWCFEAALVVPLFGIDDTSFRDHEHYPGDLVHFA